MANPTYDNVNQYGQKYLFGLRSDEAPTISGFKCISLDLKSSAPVFVEAKDGEGLVDSVTVTKGENAMIEGSAAGYITDIEAYAVLPGESFLFEVGGVSRRFIIKDAGLPLKNGELVEASLSVISHVLITDDHD